MATLSKLPAVFKKGGTTTAGNSSQVCSTPANCKAQSERSSPISSVLRTSLCLHELAFVSACN